jgi:hypothetical protein
VQGQFRHTPERDMWANYMEIAGAESKNRRLQIIREIKTGESVAIMRHGGSYRDYNRLPFRAHQWESLHGNVCAAARCGFFSLENPL